jgi:hypothetical protein
MVVAHRNRRASGKPECQRPALTLQARLHAWGESDGEIRRAARHGDGVAQIVGGKQELVGLMHAESGACVRFEREIGTGSE